MRKKVNKKNYNKKALLTAGAIAGVATIAAVKAKRMKDKSRQPQITRPMIDSEENQVYLVGGGLASLAAAAYLIRDCNFKGENIHIYEGLKVLGGSNDGAGSATEGFVCRGGRMLNEETYENFWELFSSIPSLDFPGKSVTEEILNFDHLHPTHAQARLIDKYGSILNAHTMGFDNTDRMLLSKLWFTPEDKLDNLTIEDWFGKSKNFFQTNFWHMWQTTFAFQKWSSLFEFKRYIGRMILEYSRIDTLAGVTRTPYNQYDSVILPIKSYLSGFGVDFNTSAIVTDIDFNKGEGITATAIHIEEDGEEKVIALEDGDVCIATLGCMTDSSTLGDMNTAPEYKPNNPISGDLWAKIAGKKPGLGNPEPFFGNPERTNWESFNVTFKGDKMLKLIEQFSGNIPGSGALMTFKDSSWLMSIVIAAQPYFRSQPMDTTMLWAYGLYTDRIGDYVKKPMRECTGEELLTELICQLHMEEHLDEIMKSVVNVIPCMMPYIDSQFEPRKMSDRPKVVPDGSTNFAMIGQYVEIPEDMVFTEEYSVRGARIAVYELFGVKNKKICPVTEYKKDPKILMKAVKTSFR